MKFSYLYSWWDRWKYYVQGFAIIVILFLCVGILAYFIDEVSGPAGPSFSDKCSAKGGITVSYSHGKSTDDLCFHMKDAVTIK